MVQERYYRLSSSRKSRQKKISLRKVAILFVATTTTSMANGLLGFPNSGTGAGMGGAGVALPRSPDDMFGNPSLSGFLDNEVSVTPFYSHEDKSSDTSKSALAPAFGLPAHTHKQKNHLSDYLIGGFLGANYHLNQKWSIGTGLSGGNGRTKYKRSILSPALSFPHKFGAMAAIMNPTLAWRPCDNQGYGISPLVALVVLKGDPATPAFTISHGANKKQYKPGLGVRVGGMWKLTNVVHFGASISSPVYVKRHTKYKDALPHALNIPAIVIAGIAWHISRCTQFAFDLQGVYWKSVHATGNDPKNGGFGWKNTFSVKTGIQHQFTEKLTLRTGYAYESMAIPKHEMLYNSMNSPLAYAEHIATVGGTYMFTKRWGSDFGFAYQFPKKLKDNGHGFHGPLTKNITAKCSSFWLFAGIRWKF